MLFTKAEAMPNSWHITFIKYMGILATVLGFLLTMLGFTSVGSVSAILIYTGFTLLMCGAFFCLAFRSLSRYENSQQTLPTEETLTDEVRDSRYDGTVNSTYSQCYVEKVRKHINLSNQTRNPFIIKIHQSGFTSFEMILPNQLDPAIFSASSLAGLEVSFLNSHQIQTEILTNLIAVLKRFCSAVQFQNGRAYIYDDDTLAIHLWPTDIEDLPPKYTEVCHDVDLPSYCDVTSVDIETVDESNAERKIFHVFPRKPEC